MVKINRRIPTAQLKLILFDLDGTLIDSTVDLANAVNAMMRAYNRPELPVPVIVSFIGDGAPLALLEWVETAAAAAPAPEPEKPAATT